MTLLTAAAERRSDEGGGEIESRRGRGPRLGSGRTRPDRLRWTKSSDRLRVKTPGVGEEPRVCLFAMASASRTRERGVWRERREEARGKGWTEGKKKAMAGSGVAIGSIFS